MLYNSIVMSATRKSFSHLNSSRNNESGNILVYVLIVVALLAALNFTLARNTDTAESNILSGEKVGIAAGQILQVSGQIKQVIDMMLYSGSIISDTDPLNPPDLSHLALDFTTPDDEPNYSTPPHVHKVFHPNGGGGVMPRIPAEAIAQTSTDPVAQWYIGRFNNVEWTDSSAEDVILVAHQIAQPVCAAIDEEITGSSTIPVLAGGKTLQDLLIYDGLHTGTNEGFDAVDCPDCDGWPTLCISNAAGTMFSFYSIVAQQ